MIVLGVDQSLRSTGLAVVENGKLIAKGVVNTVNLRGSARLFCIEQKISEVIDWYRPGAAARESLAFGVRKGMVFDLGMLAWAVDSTVIEHGLKIYTVNPSQVKKFATNNGHADKPRVRTGIRRLWGWDIAQDDEADACVLAMIHWYRLTGTEPPYAFQKKIISDLVNGIPRRPRKPKQKKTALHELDRKRKIDQGRLFEEVA